MIRQRIDRKFAASMNQSLPVLPTRSYHPGWPQETKFVKIEMSVAGLGGLGDRCTLLYPAVEDDMQRDVSQMVLDLQQMLSNSSQILTFGNIARYL